MESVQALLAVIADDPDLSALLEVAETRSRGNGPVDPGHDIAHFLRVALWTLRIGAASVDRREAIAAALLHDIVNLPKDSALRGQASQLCADEAGRILLSRGFAPESTQRICDAIRCHSFSRGEMPTTPLGRALQDADRLEALGSIGIFRCLSTGARMGAAYFHPKDPWARSRSFDDKAYSVDHFFTKLLKLPDTMTTELGRREASRRAERMRRFLSDLGEELGTEAPL